VLAECYTVEPMVCIDPKAKPIVGLARVGMIRSTEPPRGKVTDRANWYDYVHANDFPTIAVIQDIDDRPAMARIGVRCSPPSTRRLAPSGDGVDDLVPRRSTRVMWCDDDEGLAERAASFAAANAG
jgi:hypothetical protein